MSKKGELGPESNPLGALDGLLLLNGSCFSEVNGPEPVTQKYL